MFNNKNDKTMIVKCSKCNTEFEAIIAEMNVITYGEPLIFACPKCHKPYRFSRVSHVQVDECYCHNDTDDWGNKVVNDGKESKYIKY